MLKIVQNLNGHLKAERPQGETFHLRPSDFHKMLIIWNKTQLASMYSNSASDCLACI